MQEKTRISPTADPLADVDPLQRPSFDEKRIENAVREIIIGIGEDPNRPGLQGTPARVADSLKENFAGIFQDSKSVLYTSFDLSC